MDSSVPKVQEEINQTVPQQPAQPLMNNNPSFKKAILIISAVILFIVIAGGAYLLGTKNNKTIIRQQATSGISQSQLNETIPSNQIQKVVFTKNGDIWIINSDGTNLQQLTNYGANFRPQLSPSGNYIAYYSVDEKVKPAVLSQTAGGYDDTRVNIWSIKVDGSNAVKLTDSNTSAHRTALAWSPTGKQLMYYENGKVIIINPDGTNKKIVADLNTISDIATNSASPIWSPEGNNIALTALTKVDSLGEGSPDFSQILLYDLNGTLVKRYTNPLRFLSYWSPDNKLYFIDGTNGILSYGLESINLDGTGRTLISGVNTLPAPTNATNSAIYGAQEYIEVSKDRKTIATVKHNSSTQTKTHFFIVSTVWLMSTDGSNSHPIQLPSDIIGVSNIKWLPDNKHIVFQTHSTGIGGAFGLNSDQSALYTINVDGSDLKVIDPIHNVSIKSPYIINDDEISTGIESLY